MCVFIMYILIACNIDTQCSLGLVTPLNVHTVFCMFCDLWFVSVCGYAEWCGGVGVGDKVSCWHWATPGKLMGQPRLEGERRSPGGSSWGRRGLSCEALSRSLQAVLVLLCGSQVFSVRCERSTRKSAAREERATF